MYLFRDYHCKQKLNMLKPVNLNNMNTFSDEITTSLRKAVMKYENIVILYYTILHYIMLTATFSNLQT